ncbi:MAG: O-antigen ligase family protein [bacterium]
MNDRHDRYEQYLAWYATAVLCFAIVGLLSIRSAANLSVLLLLVPALLRVRGDLSRARDLGVLQPLGFIAIALCLPLVSVILGELLRGDFSAKPLDAPSRLAFCVLPMLMLWALRVNVARLVRFSAPIALVVTLVVTLAFPQYTQNWGGRFATRFVDPNSLGAFSAMLCALCLFGLRRRRGDDRVDRAAFWLALVGLGAGLWLILGAGSRGGMVAYCVVLVGWLVSVRPRFDPKVVAISAMAAAAILSVNLAVNRAPVALFASAPVEVHKWLTRTDPDTSSGQRLSMWLISVELIARRPFAGYGDRGLAAQVHDPVIVEMATPLARSTLANNGPHNEILAAALRSGVHGGIAVIVLFMVPAVAFWRRRNEPDPDVAMACRLGLGLLLAMAAGSITIEVFTLKYAASGFGLLLAALAAQALRVTNQSRFPAGGASREAAG